MRWNYGKTLILCFILSVASLPSALAAEPAENLGTLVQLADIATVAQMPEGITEICGEAGVYLAENDRAVARLAQKESIAYTEPNIPVELYEGVNDPKYAEQWNLHSVGIQYAWDNHLSGDGVRIGIVDSGINRTHEDFAGANIETGHDYVDKDSDPTDTTGHGTFIAGTIAAQVNNGLGIAGIAPNVTIVPLRCFSSKTSSLDIVVEAIYAAINEYNCQIINLSLGTTQDSKMLKDAIDLAEQKGVVVVAAAGNDGTKTSVTDRVVYPAGYDSVISVGATDYQGELGYFSQKNDKVFLAAPGVNMVGPWYTSTVAYSSGSGTSYAAPVVAAVIALMKAAYPNLTPQDIRAALQQTATDLGPQGRDNSFGYGLINIPAVFRMLKTPTISATRTPTGLVVEIVHGELPPGQSVTLYIAAYDAAGRLCGLALHSGMQIAQDGQLCLKNATVSGAEGAVQVKALFLNEATLTPLCTSLQLDGIT